MENLDIYILTAIVATLFAVFLIGTYRTIMSIDTEAYKTEKEGGPRVAMMKFVGRIFDNETIPKEEKKKIYKVMTQTLSDMESDGIYFPQEVIDVVEKQKDALI